MPEMPEYKDECRQVGALLFQTQKEALPFDSCAKPAESGGCDDPVAGDPQQKAI